MGFAIVCGVSRESLTSRVSFEQLPERSERVSPVDIQKGIPGRANSKCKGPEVGRCFACSRKRRPMCCSHVRWGARSESLRKEGTMGLKRGKILVFDLSEMQSL